MRPNQRRCISCRKVAPKHEFWRVVRVHPTHEIQLDRGMGRSAYLCPRADCLKMARKKNRLGRVLKAPVSQEIYQVLQQRLSSENASDRPDELPTALKSPECDC